jgi:hypothetical protein
MRFARFSINFPPFLSSPPPSAQLCPSIGKLSRVQFDAKMKQNPLINYESSEVCLGKTGERER